MTRRGEFAVDDARSIAAHVGRRRNAPLNPHTPQRRRVLPSAVGSGGNFQLGMVTEIGGIAAWNSTNDYSDGEVSLAELNSSSDAYQASSTVISANVKNLSAVDLPRNCPVKVYKTLDDNSAVVYWCERLYIPEDFYDINGRPHARLKASGNTGVGLGPVNIDGWAASAGGTDPYHDFWTIESNIGTDDVISLSANGLFRFDAIILFEGSTVGDIWRLSPGGTTAGTPGVGLSFTRWHPCYLHVPVANQELSYSYTFFNVGVNVDASFSLTLYRTNGSGTIDINDVFMAIEPVNR